VGLFCFFDLMKHAADLPRFYLPNAQLGAIAEIDSEEAKHARVLRLTEGNIVHLIDGKGNLFEGSVMKAGKKMEVSIDTLIEEETQSAKKLILAVAPTKNMARFEWVIEKAVEVGVNEIMPLQCEHSERVFIKAERLHRIALSAAKQSKALFLPLIHELQSVKEAFKIEADNKWIAHCKTADKASILALSQNQGSQIIFIGPEGDFSQEEIDLAVTLGFKEVSLGEKRLRTETAAIAAVIAANVFQA